MKTKVTDQELRVHVLFNHGWDINEARAFVQQYPKPQSYLEAQAILSHRIHELIEAILRTLGLMK